MAFPLSMLKPSPWMTLAMLAGFFGTFAYAFFINMG